jgi:hypothetical protein
MDLLWASDYSDTIKDAIAALIHTSPAKNGRGKAWTELIDPDHVTALILERRVESFVYRGYLIVFDIGAPWYSPDKKVLEEMLVARLDPTPGRIRDVVSALSAVAHANGCVGIAVGNALTFDGRLARVYERFGFNPEALSLYKDIRMGGVVKKVKDVSDKLGFVKEINKTVADTLGMTAQADAIKDAGQQQADATAKAAADQAAQVASNATVSINTANAQAQAVAQTQQAAINQAAIAQQASSQQTTQPQTQVDLTSNADPSSTDPRRKYQGGGASAASSGGNGGVGIRLT